MTPSNVSDRGPVSKIVVGTSDASELDCVGEDGRVVEAYDCHVIVEDRVNVLRVHDNSGDSVNGATAVRKRATENYSPKWNSVPTANISRL